MNQDQGKQEGRHSPFQDVGRRMDDEIEELIRWFNDDVVPSIRKRSSSAMRKAAEKLSQFADHMDDLKRNQ
jgi:hypothetical protein